MAAPVYYAIIAGPYNFGDPTTTAFNGVNAADYTADWSNTPIPEPSTWAAGAMLLLPFGISAARMLRKSRTA